MIRKRLFFDIETSPNLGFFWKAGFRLRIDYENIIKERAIICICWKWEHQKRINGLTWDSKQNDKRILRKFIEVLNAADEAVAHNGDQFDIKWIRTRCIKHGIPMMPKYISIDTLKIARAKFNFNSNKLDYVAKFLNAGQKINNGGLGLWKQIILKKNKTALRKMVAYCKNDVILLEGVWKKMNLYVEPKTVFSERGACPECGGFRREINKRRRLASGTINIALRCIDCGKYQNVPESKLTFPIKNSIIKK